MVAGDWWEVGKGNRPTLRDIDLKFKDLITDTALNNEVFRLLTFVVYL